MKTMKIKTSITKEGRKQAAKALGEALGVEARYLGVPSCAYGIGEMRLEKDGSLTVPDDEAERVVSTLEGLGYEADSHVQVSFKVPEFTADVDGTGVLRIAP